MKDAADLVIDTTELNIHQLRTKLIAAFDQTGDGQRLQIAVESFGYKYGLPLDADIVMDVRFLPNPHWDEALRPLTGHDPAVRDFVLERSHASQFLDQFEAMMVSLVPAYEAEGKSYLTIAIGCTGGRHRSVAVAEDLAAGSGPGASPSPRVIATSLAERNRRQGWHPSSLISLVRKERRS